MGTLPLRCDLPKAFVVLVIAGAVAFLPGENSPVSASGNFDAGLGVTLSDHTPGASADVTSLLTAGSGTLLPATSVALTPQAAAVIASPATIPAGLGDVIGTVSSLMTFGLNNGPCGPSVTTVTVTLLSASVDNGTGNLIYPSNPWEADSMGQLSPLRHDVYSVTPDNIQGNGNDFVGAAAAGSAPSAAANGLPAHVDRYPGFLNTYLDPDGAGAALPLVPLARYSGSTLVLSSAYLLQVLVFSPGAFAAYPVPNAMSDLADPTLGYASITVLNDPTAAPLATDPITDVCTPLSSTSTLYGVTKTNPCAGNTAIRCNNDTGINAPIAGAPTGRVRYQNPATTGTHTWYGFHISARDLDSDGIENALDTCPHTQNTDGDPRTTSGPDGDMIDGSCDPTPSADTNAGDHDGDDIKNAADNCPLVPNPTQAEAETTEPGNIASPRGATATDSIGDACDGPEIEQCADAVDDDADGSLNDGCPHFPQFPSGEAGVGCTNSTDDDGDGRINDGCPQVGLVREMGCNAVDDDFDGLVNDGCPTLGGVEQCIDAIDDDGDTLVNDGCPVSGAPELFANCSNATDDDADTRVNDGCPASGAPEPAMAEISCTFSTAAEVDNDLDGYPNDGCPQSGATAESGADCEDFKSDDDDNGDTIIDNSDNVNDGCPVQGGPEHGCLNNADDDADVFINDGCPSSSRVGNGHYHTVFNAIARFIGGTDADGDGWCASAQPGVPNDPDDAMSGKIPETFSQWRLLPVAAAGSGHEPAFNETSLSREPYQACNDGIDNDGDTFVDHDDDAIFTGLSGTDDCRPPDSVFTTGVDTDGDGSKDAVEALIGTSPLTRCARGLSTSVPGGLPSYGWPIDMRGDNTNQADRVTVGDLGNFTSPVRRLNTKPGDAAFNRRWDLRPGNNAAPAWITIADLAVVSTLVPPPMFEVRAFALFSVCSAHKVYGD